MIQGAFVDGADVLHDVMRDDVGHECVVWVFLYILVKYSIIQNSDVEVKEGGEEKRRYLQVVSCERGPLACAGTAKKKAPHLPFYHHLYHYDSIKKSFFSAPLHHTTWIQTCATLLISVKSHPSSQSHSYVPSIHDPPFSCFPSPYPPFNPLAHKPHHLSVLFIYVYLARSQHKLFFVCLGALSLAFYSTQREKESQCEADQRPKQLGGQGNQFKFKHAATMFPHPEKEYKGKVSLFLLYLLFYISIYKASIWST